MITIRDYVYIIVLLLALAATIGVSYGKLLNGLTERTVVQVRVRR